MVGDGAIGRPVARRLSECQVPGVELVGIMDVDGGVHATDGGRFTASDLPNVADLVIEAAGQGALAELGPRLIAAGVDVLALSVGALADPELRADLQSGPGRLFLSTGAVGGLDLLRTVADAGTLTRVTIETAKLPATLIQDWMSPAQRTALLETTSRVEVMRGSPAIIARSFPRSTNVAVSVAMAADDWDRVQAVVVADPAATLTTHVITVEATTGNYRFEIRNHPSPTNPATSELVPHAVLRAVRDLAGRPVTLI
ncbi:DUF108 domain-containing protein [Leekyejoonella antrihumi]|uniref:DUF108 domain-containing protein n=1 Tax=Leekyejoonella antrihumi TaxID=1660198 RepID=A0A563DXS3_9MICO|nr:DUF108 domain-containing protein [Leekyejoonella antrihumi]